MNRPAVSSTYRLQLRSPGSGAGFTFADAENLLDYLDALGVSHLYLSPILTAVSGSAHGYDVTDPTTLSAELGGAPGFTRLSAAARARGMGLIVDIVPNHLGVGRPEQNRWWWDVLRHGRSSDYADFFDIDWELDDGRIVLPALNSGTDLAGLTVHDDRLVLGGLMLPIAPGTGSGTAAQVLDRQHYRLVDWRSGACGYRRFMTVDSLAALRQEDRAVFDATHVEVARWFAEGLVDGIRIDHLDGLPDPIGYLRWLRELTGSDAWIVVEKLLAPDEPLEPTLPVAGTTGYDVLRLLDGVFADPRGEPALTALAAAAPAVPLAELSRQVLTGPLAADLHRLRRRVAAATGDEPLLQQALVALISRIGVYRDDYPILAPIRAAALAEIAAAAPELAPALALVETAVGTGRELAARLAQVCGATRAGAVEGRLMHGDARLVSVNELGCDPTRFAVDATEFHTRMRARAAHRPQAMSTLSTHDTQRGEDVRARIRVLSQVAERWAGCVTRWEEMVPSPDAGTGLFLWQNIFGVWPVDGVITGTLRERLHAYTTKALREAGRHTCWADPAVDFEDAVHRWLAGVFDGPAAAELTALAAELAPHAESDALGQKLLLLTAPGVPDLYQGTELWGDSLTDPDNRRPVDFAERRAALSALRHPKIRVVHAALRLRRDRPAAFGDVYRPVRATGSSAGHLLAFRRGEDVLVAVTRFTARLGETGWGDTALGLPDGRWTDRLTGADFADSPVAAALFAELPVVLLERTPVDE
ncbi:malto-oligosyltrehalose synthase [Mycobacterium sp. M1]|uniref:Malto-oligosyltrehalose synthase n=1 Tax=Mycolicibacter acidiphilus TaxID=2835306 RepID=A0ABS5RJ51_9MYCO|nr:malto-oligosyltrehalose synthase [Mycolicibacter acidiphilus]MBS9534313.1 malto-oligosyltrehalose synthase [Mycolicibacter acidiphilus]